MDRRGGSEGARGGGVAAPYSFEDACRAYLRRKPRGRTSHRIVEVLTDRIKGAAGDVTSLDVDLYIDWRLSHGMAHATVRREVTTLMAVLKQAYVGGHIRQMPTVVRPKDGAPRLRSLTPDELAAMVTSVGDAETRRLALFMAHTGARVGEAVALVWTDIDWKAGVVVLRTRKGDGQLRERRVPLNTTARGALLSQAAYGGRAGKVFRWVSASAASEALDRLAEKAAVKDFTAHDLRRTFATRLLATGTDPRTVAELLGHASLKMVMQYAVPPLSMKMDAVMRLENV